MPEELIDIVVIYVNLLEGIYMKTIGAYGHNKLEFYGVSGMASDNEFIYICDINNHRIQKLDKEGRFISYFGSNRDSQRNFGQPCNLAIFDSLLYITDVDNDRVQIFTLPEHNFIKEFSCDTYPYKICIYKSIIYISFVLESHINKYTLNGEFIERLEGFTIKEFDNIQYRVRCTDFAIYNDDIYIISEKHDVYLLYVTYNKICRMTIEGKMEDDVSCTFDNPKCLAFNNEYLYVDDTNYIYQFYNDINLVKKHYCTYCSTCIMICDDLCYISSFKENTIDVYR